MKRHTIQIKAEAAPNRMTCDSDTHILEDGTLHYVGRPGATHGLR